MIAATADTHLHQGQHSLPGPLPCPAFLCLTAGQDIKEMDFSSGRQSLGRSGREDERQDLSVVHRHSGLALPLVSHHCCPPYKSALGWGLSVHPCAHRQAGAVNKGSPVLSSTGPGRAGPTVPSLGWGATSLGTEPSAGTATDVSPLVTVPFGTGSPRQAGWALLSLG